MLLLILEDFPFICLIFVSPELLWAHGFILEIQTFALSYK